MPIPSYFMRDDCVGEVSQQVKHNHNATNISEEDFHPTKRKLTQEGSAGKKRRLVRYNQQDKALVLRRHQTDLLGCLIHGLYIEKQCCDEELQAMLMSLLPLRCIMLASLPSNKTTLDEIVYEFRHKFKTLSDKLISADEGRYGSSSSFLKRQILSSKGGSSNQLNQLLIALLRATGFETRLLYCIQPCSLHPKDHIDIKQGKLDSVVDLTQGDDVDGSSSRHLLLKSWCEVKVADSVEDDIDNEILSLISTNRRWVSIDIGGGGNRIDIDRPTEIEKSIKQSSKFQPQYAIAIEADGYLIDLSKKYLSKQIIFDKIQKEFNLTSHWHHLLFEANKNPWRFQPADDSRLFRLYELIEIINIKHIEADPKSFAAYKDHPSFVLERDLRSNEALNPKKKKAMKIFRGEVVYNRDAVETIRSKNQWMKSLRQVREEEQANPVKVTHITRRSNSSSSSPSSSSSSADLERIAVKLYGSWQTEPLVVPPVVDDILPVNEHGNIEIWDGCLALVPQGAALITGDASAVIKAAKYLDLPYVAAVYGFDRNSGNYSVPRIGGVVVLAQHEASIRSAASQIFENQIEKAEMKRQAIIIKRWEHLARGLITRMELRKKYGH
jgi:hypothetical protein